MKNIAFTLAEILITLAIIGVVAAMTLPSLLTNGLPWDWIILGVVLAVVLIPAMLEDAKRVARRKANFSKMDKVARAKKTVNKNENKIDAESWFEEPKKDYGAEIGKFFDNLKQSFNNRKEVKNMDKNGIAGVVTIIVLFVIAVLLCNPIVVVGVGERGVKVTLGKVSPESLGEGMHFIMPYVQKIAKMDVKTQKYTTQTHVYTKDIQQARISYVVNYNLVADSAFRMYQEVGMDYVSKVINPVLEGTIKDVIGKWNASDLVANREEATSDILVKLHDQLTSRYVNVTSFQIVDINYSEVFERAIESKVTAEQDALKAKNKTVQIQEEARQKVISAEAEAKSMSIRANALTQNKALVEYEAVQKWNGILPQYMMGNSVPFINLKSIKETVSF